MGKLRMEMRSMARSFGGILHCYESKAIAGKRSELYIIHSKIRHILRERWSSNRTSHIVQMKNSKLGL